MLGGGFAESSQSTVRLPETRLSVLRLICHYLYGCRWCAAFSGVDMDTLLELVLATDKYLLPEFNASASQVCRFFCRIFLACMHWPLTDTRME